MRLQRAHANLLSQGKGRPVVAGSLSDVRGVATGFLVKEGTYPSAQAAGEDLRAPGRIFQVQ